jgi:hypothetical protein
MESTLKISFEPLERCVIMHIKVAFTSMSIPCNSPDEVLEKIEEYIGKGSYLVYNKDTGSAYVGVGKEGQLPYVLQGLKTDIIDKGRMAAIRVWGAFPGCKPGEWEWRARTKE